MPTTTMQVLFIPALPAGRPAFRKRTASRFHLKCRLGANQVEDGGLPTLLDRAAHLRGFRFLYDFRGDTVLVDPLVFGFWSVAGSVPMRGVGFTRLWPNGSVTPLLPGFRSVDIVSLPVSGQ